MKNVTITLDEEVARWVRVSAARHNLSVSRYVGELLKSQMESERGYEQAMRSFLGRKAKALKTSGGYPGRDEIHDRSVLR
jgi:plasmid stability protein